MLFLSCFFQKLGVEFSAVADPRISPPLQARATLLQEGCDNCVSFIPTVMPAGQTSSAIRGVSSSQPPLPLH